MTERNTRLGKVVFLLLLAAAASMLDGTLLFMTMFLVLLMISLVIWMQE